MKIQWYAQKLGLAVLAYVARLRIGLQSSSLALQRIATEKGLPFLRKNRWRNLKRILFVTPAALYFAFHVCRSQGNPRCAEIVVGSILFPSVMVVTREVIQGFREKGLKNGPWGMLPVTVLLLAGLATVLIYASNTPKNLRAEIPVTYLVDTRTHELPDRPFGNGEIGGFCYLQARLVFKHFIESTPRAAAAIDAELKPSRGSREDGILAFKTFHDFIEYLVVYYLGSKTTDGDWGVLAFRREVNRWLAIPNASIRGEIQPFSQITGVLTENLFSSLDLNGIEPPGKELSFWMPKDTHMSWSKKDGVLSSTLSIANKFIQINIGIAFLPTSSQGWVFLLEQQEAANVQGAPKGYHEFGEVRACIYYDVTYDRWRYGYREMRAYEEWSKDLLSFLQRSFSWRDQHITSRFSSAPLP